jgi:hypothetical protein
MPRSQPSGAAVRSGGVAAAQNRATSAGVSSTRKAQPCVKPALGARTAVSSSRSSTAASTGSDV